MIANYHVRIALSVRARACLHFNHFSFSFSITIFIFGAPSHSQIDISRVYMDLRRRIFIMMILMATAIGLMGWIRSEGGEGGSFWRQTPSLWFIWYYTNDFSPSCRPCSGHRTKFSVFFVHSTFTMMYSICLYIYLPYSFHYRV